MDTVCEPDENIVGVGREAEIERAAACVAEGLRRILAADREARDRVGEALHLLSTLQGRIDEWQELRRILQGVIVSFSPFYLRLRSLGCRERDSVDVRAVLLAWRLCQGEIDSLIDSESRMQVRCAVRKEGESPDWVARVASLRRELENRLRRETWPIEELIDLADEFYHVCSCYLDWVARELHREVEMTQRLYACLFGGLV